jgi:hypothetical protein
MPAPPAKKGRSQSNLQPPSASKKKKKKKKGKEKLNKIQNHSIITPKLFFLYISSFTRISNMIWLRLRLKELVDVINVNRKLDMVFIFIILVE